jgi:hypothetical protein
MTSYIYKAGQEWMLLVASERVFDYSVKNSTFTIEKRFGAAQTVHDLQSFFA